MSAGKYNIDIEQGADFNLNLAYKDSAGTVMNLNGYTARMKIKDSPVGSVIASTESSDSPLNTLTPATSNGSSGTNITITMTATNTANLDFEDAVYDLELVTGSNVDRVIEGKVRLSKEITK